MSKTTTNVGDNTSPVENCFSPFHVVTNSYKVVEDHPILVDIFVPKKLLDEGKQSNRWNQKRPVLVWIHGGWLIGGQRNFAPWIPDWIVALALKHDAIFVAPDYRLLPEASAEDVLDDVDDFWAWVEKGLPADLQAIDDGLTVDFDRIAVAGSSAGGYLAVQLALSADKSPGHVTDPTSPGPRVRVVVPEYPMLGFRSPWWTIRYHKQLFDAPQLPESVIDNFLASVKNTPKREVVTNVNMETDERRRALPIALIQHGRFNEILGEERDKSPGKRRIHPEDRIEDGRKLPPVLFVHGIDDSAVPVGGTDNFIELVKKYKAIEGWVSDGSAEELMDYARVPGDHGFDTALGLDTEVWLTERVPFIEKHWLI